MQFTLVQGYCGPYALDKFVYLRTGKCFFRRRSDNMTQLLACHFSIILFVTARFVSNLIAIYKLAKAPVPGSHSELAGDKRD